MAQWMNFYIQKTGTSTGGTPYPVYESVRQWGVWCKSIPFTIMEKTKDPAKRSWFDEDGDDEYIPDGGLRAEAYTMKIEFGCKKMPAKTVEGVVIPAVEDVRQKVGAFIQYLKESGMMNLYSSYTRIGRQNVRLESVASDAKWESKGGQEFLVFTVNLRVTDPVTDITLSL